MIAQTLIGPAAVTINTAFALSHRHIVGDHYLSGEALLSLRALFATTEIILAERFYIAPKDNTFEDPCASKLCIGQTDVKKQIDWEGRMNSEAMQQFTIKANIVRYEKILATYLTPAERSFVERRLKEERMAFQLFVKHQVYRANTAHRARSAMLTTTP